MTFIRVLGRIVGTLVVLVAMASAAVVLHGRGLAESPIRRRVPEFHAATDSASIARGRHIAEVSCIGCHSPNGTFPLSGSHENFLAIDSTRAMGVLWAPNLTPGGVLAHATDGALARAVREGIAADGHPLVIMPSAQFHAMSDVDLAGVIGFLRSQPVVPRTLPARKLGLTPYVILGLHQFPVSVQPAIEGAVAAVPAGVTPAYGLYLARLSTCGDCHGDGLHGRTHGPGPIAPDIHPAAAHGEAVFDRALRHGIASDGHPLDPSRMPWTVFSHFSDDEMRAILAYVQSLPG